MEHMKLKTPDMVEENIEKIKALFPSVMTEGTDENGNIKEAINFEALKQLLSKDVVEGDECYEFTWVGKKAAMAEAAKPTTKTLRPVTEDSKDWDTTGNLYIEGDNIDVLKILQESYLEKVKIIYIDPPYNTGNDSFLYPDKYKMEDEEYQEGTGINDEYGNIQFQENSITNPKYHSVWCSMIYQRILLCRNLLTKDGVIFLSIGDEEMQNLKKICDEVFGISNYIACITRIAKTTSFRGNYFAPSKDYILAYAKDITYLAPFQDEISNDDQFKKVEIEGPRKGEKYRDDIAFYLSTLQTRPNQRYFIQCPDGELVVPPGQTMPTSTEDGAKAVPVDGDGVWRWERDNYLQKQDLLVFKQTKTSPLLNSNGKKAKWNIYTKSYLKDKQEKGNIPRDIFEGFLNRNGSEELKKIDIPFSFPKPSKLIKYLIKIVGNSENAIILDFFSGSASTAHATMQINAEDGGKRKFIMVQFPEHCDEKSEAAKVHYSNICEIGKDRIRRGGDKIKESSPLEMKDLDIGFRVFRVAESNMKDVYYHPEELDQMSLNDMISNIKEDRTDMDLLYSCLLDWGVEINLPHTTTVLDGCTIHNVDNGALMACFNEKVPASVIQYMAKQQPLRVVFRDSGFAADDAKINVEETFKNFSPDTSVRVL